MSQLIPPRFQAHRGSWDSKIRENSLEAFQQAQVLGFSMVECDIRLSRDMVPVVFHDGNLKRNFGKRNRIRAMPSRSLGEKYQIPTLEEVLTAPSMPKYFNIEIKNESLRFDLLEKKVAEVIQQTGSIDRVIVSSFNPMSLVKIRKLLPAVQVGLLVTQEKSLWNTWPLRSFLLEPLVKPDFLHLDCDTFSDRWIQALSQKYFVAAWTVQSIERGQKLLDLGVQSLIIDHLKPADFNFVSEPNEKGPMTGPSEIR